MQLITHKNLIKAKRPISELTEIGLITRKSLEILGFWCSGGDSPASGRAGSRGKRATGTFPNTAPFESP